MSFKPELPHIVRQSRREFIRLCGQAVAVVPLVDATKGFAGATATGCVDVEAANGPAAKQIANRVYRGEMLSQIAFPLGGMGAGMFCLEGNGALTKFSLRNRPELNSIDPMMFGAVSIKGRQNNARILQGPVPIWKLNPRNFGTVGWYEGFPGFHSAEFSARFPFASVELEDKDVPLILKLTGWSPFEPGDADNSSLPVAGLEYAFTNRTGETIDAIFSFNAENILAEPRVQEDSNSDIAGRDRILPIEGGFKLFGAGSKDRPWDSGYCAIWTDDPKSQVDYLWSHISPLMVLWNNIESGEFECHQPLLDGPSPGASIVVPFTVPPGGTKTITVRAAWHFPNSDLWRAGMQDKPVSEARYRPWYSGKFADLKDIITFWDQNYTALRRASDRFSQALHDSTLPPEAVEAVSANLSILKSPTILRQVDGRLWHFEGCDETAGLGDFGAAIVGNYDQALAHLFPDLQRDRLEIQFGLMQDDRGLIALGMPLPIQAVDLSKFDFPEINPESQFGYIINFYRDWRISGDTNWLRHWWPKIRSALDYGVRAADPDRVGWIAEPHATNYDNILWGPDSMCSGVYLAALQTAIEMGNALGEPIEEYRHLAKAGVKRLEEELFNGEFFIQKIQWTGLHTPFPKKNGVESLYYSPLPEGLEYAAKVGPFGQTGPGCFADGVYGAWLLLVSGAGKLFDANKVKSHLTAVHRHNFKEDLTSTVMPGRAAFGCGAEAGLVNCTWPLGGRPAIMLRESLEVWTGIEHEVASHLIAIGKVEEGMDIVRATRHRYDGRIRNPFAEVEWGHWYIRALSSYALLQAFSGARFDAVEKVLYLKPSIKGDFRCFIATATGYGTVGVKNSQPFLSIVCGDIPYSRIEYTPAT